MHGGHGGSGTVVYVDEAKGAGMVLTNRHVVGKSAKATITFPSGASVEGDVIGIDKDGADLGTIAIPADASTPRIPLAPSCPHQGAEICQVGYGGGQMQRRYGSILGYREKTARAPYNMMLSFPVIPGDSGSGVFLPDKKQLVGVVWGGPDYNWQPGQPMLMEPQAVTLVNASRFTMACRPLLPILPWRRKIEGQIRPGQPRQPGQPPVGGGPPIVPVPPGQPVIPPPMPPADYGLDGIKKEIQDLRDAVSKIPSGPAGKDGADGRAGVVGPPGPDGLRGPAGKDGIAGLQGAPGLPGKDGKNGLDGTNGAPGSAGKNGSPGLDGLPGKDGKDGLQGPSGKDGAAGKDADASGLQAQIDLLKSKGFICELYDQSGRLIQTVPFGFTEPLRIKLIPITPK